MESLNTYNWSKNLKGLENNILDSVLKKQDELEETFSPPSRSPAGKLPKTRAGSKKPSRVVVPDNRQLSFYNNALKPAKGIFVEQIPIQSMPLIRYNEDDPKFVRVELHSPSLQVLPTYAPTIGELRKEINSVNLKPIKIDHQILNKKSTLEALIVHQSLSFSFKIKN